MVAKVTIKGKLPLAKIAVSGQMLAQLEPFAKRIYDGVRQDSNETFVASVRMRAFKSGGKLPRVSWQVGAAPIIGRRIEAKRGVFARVVGAIGFAKKGTR